MSFRSFAARGGGSRHQQRSPALFRRTQFGPAPCGAYLSTQQAQRRHQQACTACRQVAFSKLAQKRRRRSAPLPDRGANADADAPPLAAVADAAVLGAAGSASTRSFIAGKLRALFALLSFFSASCLVRGVTVMFSMLIFSLGQQPLSGGDNYSSRRTQPRQ